MEKKKVLIVNNNMHIGGVQKALIGFLNALKETYDVTLLLFNAEGELMDEIPPQVHVIQTKSLYRYIGMSQRECRNKKETLVRGFFALISRVLGAKYIFRMMSVFSQKDDLAFFDTAVSYLHCAQPKSFYGGTAQYVLDCTDARKKVCYIHCDYVDSGTVSPYSKAIYRRFDALIGVSESVANRVKQVLPDMEKRILSQQNPINISSILRYAQEEPFSFDHQYLNCLTVARLSDEKGIDRFIRVMGRLQDSAVRYYVAGEGAYRRQIEKEIRDNGLENQVILLGEQKNPYRLMNNADLLIVPSYHEAAPVVFQEAKVLNLPVLTTNTLSAEEMVPDAYGFVVDNNEDAIETQMRKILRNPEMLKHKREALNACSYDNVKILHDIEQVLG